LFALTPAELGQVTFEQHPGRHIFGDNLLFRDENNRSFRINEWLNGQDRPVILVLGYYRCPMLCRLINDGLIQALQELHWTAGRDFQVVQVSIDPKEMPKDAGTRKMEYLRQYGRVAAENGWHCLVGNAGAINQLADQVGYRYIYDKDTDQYAHPSGLIILAPHGKISRYLLGVNFRAKDLNDALLAAKDGQSSSVMSKIVLLCYHYNPITGKYAGTILTGLRVASVVMFVILLGAVVHLTGGDRRALLLIGRMGGHTSAIRPDQ
jgi:protein SCO1